MSLIKLFEEMQTKQPRNTKEISSSDTIDNMMGFSPVETIIRDVEGAPDKEFRVRRMV